ncbi:MAG: acyl--CoA ligase [Desulfobulbaceae bacterium]|nr:acyl--CoA ligase [Desulfobulbaceae bacterium]
MNSSATTLVDIFSNQDEQGHVGSDLLFQSPSEQLSYREAWSSIITLAAFFQELGLLKRDNVYLALENGPQFIISFFAILKAGATVVLLDDATSLQKTGNTDDPDLVWSVSRSTSKARQNAIVTLDPWDKSVFIKKSKDGLEQENISFENVRYFVPNNTWSPLPEVSPKDLAVTWKYFNETSEEDIKTHQDFIAKLRILSKTAHSRHDQFLSNYPLNHNNDLIQHILLPIFLGATICQPVN